MRQPRELGRSARGARLAANLDEMEQRKIPPLIAASVVTLVLTIVGFWGYATHDARASRIAHIGRTRATLNDGACTFAAALTLTPQADQWAFERRQGDVRQALIALLRTKSRYMVSNPTAREALRVQMLREVNRVMDEPIAHELRFTEFVLS
jgi:flagellar basal body-associated protein FliL